MVAIVGGNRLGLNLGSLAALGRGGVFGTSTQGRSGDRAYVNVSTGDLVLEDLDNALVGLGPDTATLRTYNSQSGWGYNVDSGNAWQFAPKKYVRNQGTNTLRRYDIDGAACDYLWDATRQLYVASLSAGSALDTIQANADGTYTWTDGATGATEHYAGGGWGQILSSTDTSGNTVRFDYNNAGLVTRVTTADGETIEYTYGGVGDRDVLQVTTRLASGQVLSQVSYAYDGQDRLATVTVNLNPDGSVPGGSETSPTYVTSYTYEDNSNRVSTITQSDGTTLKFTYVVTSDSSYRIATVTDGAGQVTSFAYDLVNRTTTVTDPFNVSSVYRYDAQGQLVEVRNGVTAANPTGLASLQYAYNSIGDVTGITDGLGNTVTMSYDANGNLTSQVDADGDTLVRTYDGRNQVLTETVYAAPATGSTPASQPQTTRYVYDAGGRNLLRFVVTPEGRVTEYRYNAQGLRTSTIEYPSAAYDTSALGITGVPTEPQMATWTAAQDLTQCQRTDVTYDFRGQVQTVTSFKSVDATGAGVDGSTTHYVYDQRGLLLQTITPDGQGTTQSIYDGLGRVVSTVSQSLVDSTLSNTTVTQYDDTGAKTTVTLANGLVTTSAFDTAGRLVSVMQSSSQAANLGTTRYFYDADGRLLMTQDPTGERTWNLFDAAGRKVADVDATGALTEYVYDSSSRLTEVIHYHTAVDTTALVDANGLPTTAYDANPAAAPQGAVTLASIRPAATDQDTRSWNLYDEAGRLTWQIDALGYATHTEYDGASRVVSVTRLATPIDTSQLGNGQGIVLAPGGFGTKTSLSETVSGTGPNAPRVLTATVTSSSTAPANAPTGTVTFFAGQTCLGAAAVVNGVATLTVSNLPVGQDLLTAVYGGDANNLGSASSAVTDTVVAAFATTTTLSAAPSTAAGASLRLTATVAGQNPAGTVLFYDAGVPIGSASVVGGTAALDVNSLPVGTNTLTAVYLGDANNATSTSAAVTEVVTAASTATVETVTTLEASNALADPGSPVTLTATVTGANPTGTVTFYSGTTALGTVALSNGIASMVVSNLPVGADTLSATYSGDASNSTSTSATVTERVLTRSSTALSLSTSSSTLGSPVTLTASVTGSSPGGTVSFFNGATLVGSATVAGGVATLAVSSLPVGSDGITAVYSGDGNNTSSSSAVVTEAVAVAPTTTALTVSSAQSVYGTQVTLTATVSGTASPGGTVTFYNGTTALGTSVLANGQAALTVSSLPAGADSLTAVYSGDASNGTSTSSAVAETVSAAPTTTTVATSATTTTQGAAVTLTATVNGGNATGTVTFLNGTTVLGITTMSGGVATLTLTTLPVGTTVVTASYSGDANYAGSVGTVTQTVVAAPTSVTLTTSSSSAAQGASVILTARVTSSASTLPSGTVTFYSGTTSLGTATLTDGIGAITVATLPVGSDSLTASYAGDASNSASTSAPVVEVVTAVPATTTTTLTASASTVNQGQSFTLTAKVAGSSPTGLVTFFNGQASLGTAAVVNGTATLTTSIYAAGTASIVATYDGDGGNATSVSSAVSVKVNSITPAPKPPPTPPATTTTLTVASSSTPRGTPVVLTATVSGGTAGTTPTGTVSFFNGATLVGSAALVNGTATLSVANLPVGTTSFTAVYSGDTASAASASSAVSETVTLASSVTTLTASTTQLVVNGTVTLVAQVSGDLPTGTVTWYSGTTAITSTTVTNGLATVTLRATAAGVSNLWAHYGGDSNNATSDSTPVTMTVTSAPTSTTTVLQTSTSSTSFGSAVTLRAYVGVVQGGVLYNVGATGTATFFNGSTLLGSAALVGGVATLTLTNLPVGSDSLKAVYSGDASDTSSTSSAVLETVAVASTTTTLTTSTAQTAYGSAVTLTAAVSGVNPSGAVTFYTGSTAIGTGTVVNGQATLTISSLPVGTDALKAVYAGDANNGTSTSTVVNETVVAAPTTTTVTSSAPSIGQGGSVTFTAQVTGVNGNLPTGTVTFFNGTTVLGTATLSGGQASLTVSGLPGGSDAISVGYSGDTNDASSVGTLTESVAQASTTTVLTSSSASAAQGSPVILTARVTGTGSTIPSGTVTFYAGATALGTAALADGLAAITVTTIPVGTTSVTASYSGDTSNSASSSAPVSEVITATPAATTTSLTSSATSVTVGQSFTLTATVTGTSPSGLVTFFNGQTVLGTSAVVGGVAKLTTTLSATGTANIVATYSGDAANATSVSGTVAISVSKGTAVNPPKPPPATTTALSLSSLTSTRGTAVVATATVSGGTTGVSPTGTVSFFNGTTLLGSATVQNGTAKLSLTGLPVGSDSITAVYSGDASAATSTSSAAIETVSLGTSSTALAASATQIVAGATLTLVAQVQGVVPGGTVTFYNGRTALGTATVSDGLARLDVTSLAVGTASITAQYGGDSNNATSTSAAATVTVTAAPTTSTTSLSASTTSSTLGAPVTLTATVTGTSPTGTISFFNGSTLLGSATVVSGSASLTVSGLPVGTDGVTAVYSGDATNTSSKSAVVTETVQVAPTTTTLTTSTAQTTYGTAVTLTAIVTGTASPTGTVTFYSGGTVLGASALVNGQATLTVSSLPVGTDTLSAVYSGDGNNGSSTSAVSNETVAVAPTTLTLTSGASVARNGAISIRVSGASPTGTVTFLAGTTVLGTAAVVNGVATLVGADLPVGNITLSATYSGDGNNGSSVLVFAQNVTPAPSVTMISAATSYAAQNHPLVLTARVAGSDPTGTVIFYAGTTRIGSATLANGLGAITVSSLPPGVDSLTAVYSGDANNAASTSAAISENVVAAPVYVTLSASTASVARGGTLTLTATVTGNVPTGQVSFVSGDVVLGSATLVNGVATLTVTGLALPAGSDAIVAAYAGDANNAATLSGAVTETVTPGIGTLYVGKDPTDRAGIRLYDRDGRLRATVDGEGYLTETRYDAAGRPVETIAYANKVTGFTDAASIASRIAAARASDSIDGLRPPADAGDVSTFTFYDASGRQIGRVDGERYLTETVYDVDGRVSKTIRYANPARTPVTASSTLDQLRPVLDDEDQTLVNTWDDLGRLSTQTNAENTVTRYTYDKLGHVIDTTVVLETGDRRTLKSQYDVQGRVTAELSAEGASIIATTPGVDVDQIWAQYATKYTYDAAGRRTSSTDPLGQRTVFLYDEAGRLRFTVNAEGEVAERTYDALGHLTGTTQIATRLAAADFSSFVGGVLSSTENQAAAQALANARTADAADNSTISYAYDAAGQVVATTDAEGGVTTAQHDAFGDVVGSTQAIGDGRVLANAASYDRRGLETATVSDAGDSTHVNATARAEYDAFGRFVKSWDADGNLTQRQFDRLGRVVEVTDPTLATRQTTYDAFSRVLTQTDGRQNTTVYTYSTANRSVTVTTPEHVSITTVHDGYGETVSVTDGNGNTTTYVYDANGNLKSTTTPVDASTSITTSNTYDRAKRLYESTDANGVVTRYEYDAANRIATRTVDPGGLALVTSYQHDAQGRTVRVTDPNGVVTETTYDRKGEVLTRTVDPGGLNLTTQFTYDARGKQLTVTDAGGSVTQYLYDDLGRRTETIVDPSGLAVTDRYEYDDAGNVVKRTDGAGGVTRYRYDGDGRLTFTVDGEGGVTKNVYDANGNVVERVTYVNRIVLAQWDPTTDPVVEADAQRDVSARTVYDGDNRAIYTIDGTGAVVAMQYDGNGNLVDRKAYATAVPAGTAATASALSDAVKLVADAQHDGHIHRVYDAANRLVYSVDGTGAVIQQVFDGNGNIVKMIAYATRIATGAAPSSVVASAADRVSVRSYDHANRMTYQVDALGGVQHQIYDADGHVVQRIAYGVRIAPPTATSVAPATGDVAQSLAAAQAAAQAAGETPPADRANRAVYDAAGRLQYGIDAAGVLTENRFDGAGNVIGTIAYATPIGVGQLPDVAKPSNVVAPASTARDRVTLRRYDAANRLSYSIDAEGYVTGNTYDGAGHVATSTLYMTHATGLGAGSTVGDIDAAIALVVAANDVETDSYTYDAAGNVVATTDALLHTETYQYNGAGEKTSFTNKKHATWNYDYDAAGRLVTETSPLVSLTRVDTTAAGDLVEGQTVGVRIVTSTAYDALGNVTSRTEADGLAEHRTTSYEYDALGRQVKTIYPTVGVYSAETDDQLAANGASGPATRTDVTPAQPLSTQVFYDVFGDAVASTDVSGNTSYKAYDALGRVSYEIDALGYVTGYDRDVFGDATTIARYAGKPVVTASATDAPTAQEVTDALAALPETAHADDRRITTEYDVLGRAVRVTQPTAWVDNGKGQSYLAASVVTSTYDAFGQVVQTAVLADQGADPTADLWATTTHYFDRRGLETATVDAMGYVTTQVHDAAGNVTRRTEYANPTSAPPEKAPTDEALARAWTPSSLSLPTASADDRTVEYAYDRLNRKTSDTRENVEYSTASDGSSARGSIVTRYGYDEVGNLTSTTQELGDGTSLVTHTSYDALGRTTAVVAPTIDSGAHGASITPLTVFKRDAYGNVIVKIEYANGAISATSPVPAAPSDGDDRKSLAKYDSRGNAIQMTDANGKSRFMSYDAAGRIAKQWQSVTSDDGFDGGSFVHTLFTVFQYDAAGRQTAIITPDSTSRLGQDGKIGIISQQLAGVVRTEINYDAFGEMTDRSTSPAGMEWVFDSLGNMVQRSRAATPQDVEHFEYDGAGRVWRTNSGDGNVKVTLYDLMGNQTASITSAGSAGGADYGTDLSLATSAQAVDQLGNTGVRRTDSQYNLLGRVTQQTLPQRQDSGDPAAYRPIVNQTFDRWGNVLTQSDVRNGNWITTYRYNANNQVVERTQPLVAVMHDDGTIHSEAPDTRIYYDALGHQVAIRDAKGNVTGQTWDAAGNLHEELHADGGVVTHEYNAFGNQVRLVDARQHETTYGYDKLGENTSVSSQLIDVYRVTSGSSVTSDQEVVTTSKRYDEAGRKISDTNGAGEITQYTYDLRGNLVVTRQPLGETTKSVFNANGKQTANQDGNGNVITWTYDGFGLLTGHQDFIIQPSTNPLVVQHALPERVTYSFTYDNARQLVAQSNDRGAARDGIAADATQNENLHYTYDAAGQLVEIRDDSRGTGWKITQYGYNAAGKHVWEQTLQLASATDQAELPGNIVQLPGNTASYLEVQNQLLGYDELGRLASVTGLDGINVSFSYDAVGNRRHQLVSYNIEDVRLVQDWAWVDEPSTDPDTGEPTTIPTWEYQGSHYERSTYTVTAKNLWYAYDNMNRQVLVDGVAGTIDADGRPDAADVTAGQGHILTYDRNGNRTSDEYVGYQVASYQPPQTGAWYLGDYPASPDDSNAPTTPGTTDGQTATGTVDSTVTYTWKFDPLLPIESVGSRSGLVTEDYAYDAMDRLTQVTTDELDSAYADTGNDITLEVRHYDAASRVVEAGSLGRLADSWVNAYTNSASNAVSSGTRVSTYDGDGRLLTQNTTDPDSSKNSYVSYTAGSGRVWTTTELVVQGTDSNGNPIYVQSTDGTGNVITDGDGNTVMIEARQNGSQKVTADGTPLYVQSLNPDGTLAFDSSGNPVLEPLYNHDGDVIYEADGVTPVMVAETDGTGKALFDAAGNKIWATYQQEHHAEGGYDEAGNVKAYSSSSQGVTSYYQYSQVEYDGYREGTVTGYRSDNAGVTGSTTSGYDANGFVISVTDATKSANDRTFWNDANGHVLLKRQVERERDTNSSLDQGQVDHTNLLRQLVVEGNVVAVYGAGTDPKKPATDTGDPRFNDRQGQFDLNFEPVTSGYPGPSAGLYKVQAGDTLEGIAQVSYGDSSQWYVIANANGLRGDQDLRVGQTLIVPSRVGGAHNTSDTFRPYDPSKIVGDTTPNLPVPQSSGGGGGCGGWGIILTIVIVVVAVVVTVYTAGAASLLISGGLEALGSAGFAGTMAAGGLALAGGGTLAGGLSIGLGSALVGAAVGGAAGSIASQGLSMAFGMQKDFSWTQVAMGALSSTVGAGVGAAASGIQAAAEVTQLSGPTSWLVAGARTAVANAATQGIAVLTGLQKDFSWRSVAASAVGSVVGAAAGDAMNGVLGYDPTKGFDFAKSLVSGTVSGFTAGVTVSAMQGGRIDFVRVATDAFGNALANSMTQAMSSQEKLAAALQKVKDAQTLTLTLGGKTAAELQPPDWKLRTGLDLSGASPEAVDTDVGNSEDPATTPPDREYTAKRGDSIARILGTSDPQAIGAFMAANGLTSSTIRAGDTYIIPSDPSVYGDTTALGQSALDRDNARLAAIAEAAARRQAAEEAAAAQAATPPTGYPGGEGQHAEAPEVEPVEEIDGPSGYDVKKMIGDRANRWRNDEGQFAEGPGTYDPLKHLKPEGEAEATVGFKKDWVLSHAEGEVGGFDISTSTSAGVHAGYTVNSQGDREWGAGGDIGTRSQVTWGEAEAEAGGFRGSVEARSAVQAEGEADVSISSKGAEARAGFKAEAVAFQVTGKVETPTLSVLGIDLSGTVEVTGNALAIGGSAGGVVELKDGQAKAGFYAGADALIGGKIKVDVNIDASRLIQNVKTFFTSPATNSNVGEYDYLYGP